MEIPILVETELTILLKGDVTFGRGGSQPEPLVPSAHYYLETLLLELFCFLLIRGLLLSFSM